MSVLILTGERDPSADLMVSALVVVSPTNEWVFLEVNATGQYGWLEDYTGAPFTGQLADLLAGGIA